MVLLSYNIYIIYFSSNLINYQILRVYRVINKIEQLKFYKGNSLQIKATTW